MNIIRKLRATFETCPTLRIMDLQEKLADEPPSSISMGLCYLYKQRYCTRVKVKSTRKYGRKMVYEYTYSNVKLPKGKGNDWLNKRG